jgi:putative acetyltransferase
VSASLPTAPALPAALGPARVRAATDEDAAGLIALIGGAYAEYPGCVLDLPGVDADLVAPATSAAARRVDWWVVLDPGTASGTDGLTGGIVASVAHGPRTLEGEVELKRLYVAASHRRRGLATSLVDFVVERARALGATDVVAWSDTRFADAHRLYEGLGFVRSAFTRDLDDPSCTCEAHFRRRIA